MRKNKHLLLRISYTHKKTGKVRTMSTQSAISTEKLTGIMFSSKFKLLVALDDDLKRAF